jgi:hypothetical protein
MLGLDVGASGYFGGAAQNVAALEGVRVGMAEADVRFRKKGFEGRAEYAHYFIRDSAKATSFLRSITPDAESVPKQGYGVYAEAGYDVLTNRADSNQALVPFARYERIVPRFRVVGEAPEEAKQFLVAGVTWRPHPQIAVKADITIPFEGEESGAGAPAPVTPGATEEAEALPNEPRIGVGVGFMF